MKEFGGKKSREGKVKKRGEREGKGKNKGNRSKNGEIIIHFIPC